MRKRANDRGGVGLWIFIFVLLAGLWGGYKVGRLYFDKATIENEIAVIGDEAVTSHNLLVSEKVAKTLEIYGGTVDHDKIRVEPSDGGRKITIQAAYKLTADLGVMNFPLEFNLFVQREAPKGAGVVQQVQDSIESSNAASAQKYQRAVESAVKPPAADPVP